MVNKGEKKKILKNIKVKLNNALFSSSLLFGSAWSCDLRHLHGDGEVQVRGAGAHVPWVIKFRKGGKLITK